jgi:tripartite-type tricarboxylate transporter receptor subunit TctC
MSRRSFLTHICAAAVVSVTLGAFTLPAAAAYPERPITVIVPWAAGGGTDATARILASLLERELGVPVNVVNRTGGSGVVGHTAIATAPADGYTIGIATVEIGMMHWQGLTEVTYEDYTPLILYNFDPAGLQVRIDAPYETAQDLIDAIRENPGKLRSSGTGQGGIWHLALAGLLDSLGIEPDASPWVPSQGAAPALQDLVAGGIEIVPCSVVEARSLMEAGRVKSLAVMSEERLEAFPDIPTVKEALGTDWTMGAWRGVVGPLGMPQEAVDRLLEALRKIHQGDEFREFMSAQGYGLLYAEGEEFHQFMAQSNEGLGQVMKAVGIAQ